MGVGQPLEQQSDLVSLTGLILQYVLGKIETINVGVFNHPLMGCKIMVGEKVFEGKSEEETVEKFLQWVIAHQPTISADKYREMSVLEEEPEDIDSLANNFAEGGMSEFGVAVELMRGERHKQIMEAVRQVFSADEPYQLQERLVQVRQISGIDDVDTDEILECTRLIMAEIEELELSGAIEPVLGSDDKPN